MNNQHTMDLLSEIYRGAKMGVQSINNLLTKVSDNKIYDELKYQLYSYEEIANEAYGEIIRRNGEPKDLSTLNKISAKMSIGINTFINSNPSHIADMMIKGNTMGVTEIIRKMHSLKGVDDNIRNLAERFLKLEEDNIDRLKKYL